MEATLGPIIFPRETPLRSVCCQYVFLSFSLCHYRASTTRFVGSFALILRQHCAATETVALMIMSKGVVAMLSIAPQCIHVMIPLPLDIFHPVTLFSLERRPAALVLRLLKEAPGYCAQD